MNLLFHLSQSIPSLPVCPQTAGLGLRLGGWPTAQLACRGRRRAIWLSTSTDLHHDAERDLKALGLHLQVVNNCQTLDRETRATGLSKDFQEGVLFM